jgi:hypothetical protein
MDPTYYPLLFADDQIPVPYLKSGLSDEALEAALIRDDPTLASPGWKGYRLGTVRLRTVVEQLMEMASVDVTPVHRFADAWAAVQQTHYPIAVVDYGWERDPTVAATVGAKSPAWELCRAIRRANAARGEHTEILMYSQRFSRDPNLSREAAQIQVLPVYKTYRESDVQQLTACIYYAQALLQRRAMAPSPDASLAQRIADLEAQLAQARQQLAAGPVAPIPLAAAYPADLTPAQHQECHAVLLYAFPRRAELALLTRQHLGRNLDEITGSGDLRMVVAELLDWAVAQGQLPALLIGAGVANPANLRLRALLDSLRRSGPPPGPDGG